MGRGAAGAAESSGLLWKATKTFRAGVVPPVGLEPTHPAPEAGALSAELQGRRLQIYHKTVSQDPFLMADTGLVEAPFSVDNSPCSSISLNWLSNGIANSNEPFDDGQKRRIES